MTTALCATAITSPLVLSSGPERTAVMCAVDPSTGDLRIGSTATGRPHLTSQCRAIQLREPEQQGATAPQLHTVKMSLAASPSLGRVAHDSAVVAGGEL